MSLRRLHPRKVKKNPRPETYEGRVRGIAYRDDLVLVAINDAPDDRHFVPVMAGYVPPETFYAFNTKTKQIEHMVSLDATGTHLAWDTDRGGRYFTRLDRGIMCPRSIEFSYDASVAHKAGEEWDVKHPAYRGTLSGQDGTGGVYLGSKDGEAPKRPSTGPTAPVTAPRTPRSMRPLRRTPVSADPAPDLADRAALDTAASKLADRLGKQLTSGAAKRPMRRLKKG